MKILIWLKTNETVEWEGLYQITREALTEEEFTIESSEYEEVKGMTGSDVVISILTSLATSITANLLDEKIKKAIQRVRKKTTIPFTLEKNTLTDKEEKETEHEQ